jgi:predicted amidohydrolase
MTESSIAIAQFAPGDDEAANLGTMTRLAEQAAGRGASLIVFPEYSSYFTPTMGPEWATAAQAVDGPFSTAIGSLAKRLGAHIVAGMIESRSGGRFSNTLIALSPTGELEATYRKLHLYDAFGQRESDWVVAGEIESPETFTWNGFTVGMQTCYDIRFPEVTRRIVDAGADIVLVPAEWVKGPLKEHHWRTLVTARALENTIYVAAADHAPPVGVGNSMIVDPMGVEIATIGESTGVAVAWVDQQRIDDVRLVNPALELRRFAIVGRGAAHSD